MSSEDRLPLGGKNCRVRLAPPEPCSPGQAPFVSVVIPALDCANEVDACIEALRRQDYPADRFEIIVADNGSKDGTPERLEALGVTVVHMAQRGRSKALNAGLTKARGEFVLTTDMGCVARPDWIRNVVACFDDPQVGCVAGDIAILPSGDNLALRYQARSRYMSPMGALRRRQLPYLPFADGANASFRRQVFEQIGGFDESFYKAADVEICCRLLLLTEWKIVFCPDCLLEEPGEPDLKALLHQRYRMGLGSHLLRARFPGLYSVPRYAEPPGLRRYYWALRERVGASARWMGAILTFERATLEDRCVGYLMVRAQSRGERAGAQYLLDQPLRPEPVDAAATRRFVDALHRLDERVLTRRVASSSGAAHPDNA